MSEKRYARRILTNNGISYTPAYPVTLTEDAENGRESDIFGWLYSVGRGSTRFIHDEDVVFDIGLGEDFAIEDIVNAFGKDEVMEMLVTENNYGVDL